MKRDQHECYRRATSFGIYTENIMINKKVVKLFGPSAKI